MNWPWRRRQREQRAAGRSEKKLENPRVMTTQEDLDRAEQAARIAALHLQEARDRRQDVDDRVTRIASLNRENGFAELIRNAFGS
jgi:hypothetical protein